MQNDFCPRCQQPRDLALSTSTRTTVGEDGEERQVLTRSYHCQVCGTFVRSEDEELAPQTDDGTG